MEHSGSIRPQARFAAMLGALWLSAVVAEAQPAPAAPASEAVRIVELQGKVELSTDGIRWVLTQTNQVLRPFDRLRTGPNSRVALRWSDQSVVPFGARTEIEILPPHQPAAQSGLHLVKGILSFFHRDKPGRIRVMTRGAVAGVEGTEFVVEVATVGNTEQTTLSVIDGRVQFTNEQGFLVLTNGQQAVAEVGKAPVPTPGFVANNVLQWCFYYPGVLDLRDLPLVPGEEQILSESLAAYRTGDLLAALAKYPPNRQPASDAERVYYAALLLSVGEVDQTQAALAALPAGDPSDRLQRLAAALRQLIAAVKREPNPSALEPQLSTELLAASYYEQSLAVRETSLRRALVLARRATTNSPEFGFAWTRVAELEFSFGRTGRALEALDKSLALSDRNAQALALKGFLLASQNKTREAIGWFNQAIAVDSALGNAWLGRGLCRIRRGDRNAGHEDLLVAAALEPQRSQLRAYLGKAYGDADEFGPAMHELDLAKQLDRNDPTAWLYSALVMEQENRFNEAIDNLEESKELNDNRILYRSSFRLDEDRAVRSANLARIYANAGLEDVAVREAARSIAADYGNYSSHYFLANSFNSLRRENPADLRFEAAAFSEYLLANLLGPAEGNLLAQPVSQQEYTHLFQRDPYFGFSSSTEYLSRGAWKELAAQYGTFGNSSYALEVDYLWDPGQAPNSSYEQKVGSASFKQMLTPKDGLYLEVLYFSQEAEDISVKYDPDATIAGLRTRERQEHSVLVGYDHQWNERNRTLFLAGYIPDSLRQVNPYGATYLLEEIFGNPVGFVATDLTQNYKNRLTVGTFEVQQIVRSSRFQTIAGIRFQPSVYRVSNVQTLGINNASGVEIYFGMPGDVITNQSVRLNALRISPYIYEHWQIADQLWLIGGLSYDYQEQPENLLFAPISEERDAEDQFSPKAGLIWTPTARSAVRAAYTRSLGGVGLEQSVRLEPSQLAGFVQSYRDIIPASLGYSGIAGNRVETADFSLEYQLPVRTYLALSGEWLRSTVEHDVGVWERQISTSSGPGIQTEEKLDYQEFSLSASVHQLLGDWYSVGLGYRISEATLDRSLPDLDPTLTGGSQHSRGLLQTLRLQQNFQHPSGFFAGAQEIWWSQQLGRDLGDLPEDALWQINVFAGYRSPRRFVEITIGILNLTSQDYHIHPINLYSELPRERTLFTRLVLNF